MRVLFLSRWFPYPANNGSKLRIFHLLGGLSQAHEVHLFSFSDHPAVDRSVPLPHPLAGLHTAQWKEYNSSDFQAVLGLFSPTPRSLIDTYSTEMEHKIRAALREQHFDLVILSQWQMTAYQHLFDGIPLLMEEMEVGVLYGRIVNAPTLSKRLRAKLTWFKHRRYLARILAGQQPCTVVSEQEKLLLEKIAEQNHCIGIIPNGVDLAEYDQVQAEPEAHSLIFTGSFRYSPNYQAMLWFVENVYPRIQAGIPNVKLAITGDHAGLPLPNHPGILLTGHVPDIKKLIKRSWASIAPLQVGGGTRIKILEAMALSVPVIATSKGAEGLDVAPGVHLDIADDPEEFAERTIQVLRSRERRNMLSTKAYELIHDKYDWKVIMPAFLAIVERSAALASESG